MSCIENFNLKPTIVAIYNAGVRVATKDNSSSLEYLSVLLGSECVVFLSSVHIHCNREIGWFSEHEPNKSLSATTILRGTLWCTTHL